MPCFGMQINKSAFFEKVVVLFWEMALLLAKLSYCRNYAAMVFVA